MFRKSHAAKGLAWGLVSSSRLVVAIVAGVGATAVGAWWIGTHVSIFWAVLFVLVGWTIPATVGYWAGLILGMVLAVPVTALFGGPPGKKELSARDPTEVPVLPVLSSKELWTRFEHGTPEDAYIGKFVFVNGPVRDVGYASGHPYILFDCWPIPDHEDVRCVFSEDEAPKVATLSRGYDVTVLGMVSGFRDEALELRICALKEASERNIVVTTASELWAAYDADEAAATEKYGKKMARVSGVVHEVLRHPAYIGVSFLLDAGDDGGLVYCMFAKTGAERVYSLSTGDTVTVTGRVAGRHTKQESTQPAWVSLADCTLR